MKKNISVFGALLIFTLAVGLVNIGCTSTSTATTPSSTNTAAAEQYLANDRRFDGTWELPGVARFVFYADMYTLYDEDNEAIAGGLFVFTNETIFGHVKPNVIFSMGYSMTNQKLTIRPLTGLPNNFLGDWVKINTPQPSVSNPLVGVWKGESRNALYLYQFYPDGTGISNEYPKDFQDYSGGFLISWGYVQYNINNPTFAESWEDNRGNKDNGRVTYRINGDELVFGDGDNKLVLTRQ